MSTREPGELATELEHRRAQLHGAFGNDAFGQIAEKAARFFGTPQYIVGQTAAVAIDALLTGETRFDAQFGREVIRVLALANERLL